MKYTLVAALASGASAAAYGYGYPSNGTAPSYTTEVVTAYTTYCPYATQITHGATTYTVTEATTLTITDCPCTISYPVTTKTTTSCPSSSATSVSVVAPGPVITSSAAPYPHPSGVLPPPVSGHPSYTANSTIPVYSSPSNAQPAPTSAFTGAANHVVGQAGAGLAAFLGVAAYLL